MYGKSWRVGMIAGVAAILGNVGTAWSAESPEAGKKSGVVQVLTAIRMDAATQKPAQQQARTVYDEGFTLVGEDDSLKLGAWMQNDARVFFPGHPAASRFLVRRARLDFRGSLERIFGFRVMGEFEGDNGTNAANLKEGWLEYNQFPAFRVKIGQFKEPWGLENLYGDLALDFLERPVAENFVRPEQDLGLMLFGKLFRQHLEYGVGLFNGSGTNVNENNDDKDVAARLAVTPFAGHVNRWLNHLTFGGSFTYGKQVATFDGTGPTTTAGTRYLTFVNPTGGNDVTVDDYRLRAGGDVEWIVGPFSLKGEYAWSRNLAVTVGGATGNWTVHGWHGQATYLLTGEQKTNQGAIAPQHPFAPKEGGWGAFELAGRFELARSDGSVLTNGFATGTDDLWAATGGLNWYLNRHVRWSTNYVYTKFENALAAVGGKNHEHAILTRVQFNL